MFFGRSEESKQTGDIGDEMEGYLMGRSSANSNGNYDEYSETAGKIAEKVQE